MSLSTNREALNQGRPMQKVLHRQELLNKNSEGQRFNSISHFHTYYYSIFVYHFSNFIKTRVILNCGGRYMDRRGFSLIELIVASAILVTISSATAIVMKQQADLQKRLTQKSETINLGLLLTVLYSNQASCLSQFTGKSIDTTTANPPDVNLARLTSGAGGQVMAIPNQALPNSSTGLQVTAIKLAGLQGGGGQYLGHIEVDFPSFQPVKVNVALSTGPAGSGIGGGNIQSCNLFAGQTPAQICASLGGTYNNATSTCDNLGPNAATECQQIGGTWNASANPPCQGLVPTTPQECQNLGGSWNASANPPCQGLGGSRTIAGGQCPAPQIMIGLRGDGTPICTTSKSQAGAPCVANVSDPNNGTFALNGVTAYNPYGGTCCLVGYGTDSNGALVGGAATCL